LENLNYKQALDAYEEKKQQLLKEAIEVIDKLVDTRHFGKLTFHFQNGTIIHVTIDDGIKLDGANDLQIAIKSIEALSEKLKS